MVLAHDHAVAHIRALRSMGLAARRKRVSRQQQPDAIRLEYAKALAPSCDLARQELEAVLPEVLHLLEQERLAQGRTDAPGGRFTRAAKELIAKAAKAFAAKWRPEELIDLPKFFRRTSYFQRLQLDQQIRDAIGVSLPMIERESTSKIVEWVRWNVDLIKTIPVRYFKRVEALVIDAFDGGTHPNTLAREIAARHGMAIDDARRIARDQIGKLAGDLNQERQERLGVTGYIWRTANDNRVRDSHFELEGQRCTWDDPPWGGGTHDTERGHPGSGIQCRCFGEPDFAPLLKSLR